MEDYQLDIIIGQGPSARTIKLDLPRFTLVGATTRAGLLSSPLRDRFGVISRLEFYTVEELATIVTRSARILGIPSITDGAPGTGPPQPGHAADRQPAAAAGARFRPGPGDGTCPWQVARIRWPSWRSTRWGSTRWTGRSC